IRFGHRSADAQPPLANSADSALGSADVAKNSVLKQSEDDAPPAPPRPLVIKRWNLPTWQVAPDKSRGINVFIDPNGPWVVTQSSPPPNLGRFNQPPVQPISWNAATGETRPEARVTGSGTYVKYAQVNGKLSPEIHEQTTDRKLLTLRD